MAKIILNYDEIHNRIVDIMHTKNVSKYKLAQLIGVDKSSITRIFNGERGWGLEMLSSIANVFGVSLDYLVFGKEQNEELHKKIKSLEESSERLRNNLLTQLELNKEYVLKQTDK